MNRVRKENEKLHEFIKGRNREITKGRKELWSRWNCLGKSHKLTILIKKK